MDPTMGETTALVPAVTGQATFGGGESVSDSFQAVAAADTVITEAPATNYPAGKVDFNKPFDVFSSYDDTDVHTDVSVLAVLKGNSYPVVVVSTNGVGDQVIAQFDTDGDSVDGDLKAENKFVGETTKFIAIYRDGREFGVHDELFDSEADAIGEKGDDKDFWAVLPITIPAAKQEIETEADDEEGHDEEHHEAVTAADHEIPSGLPEGSKRINGFVLKPGDKVRAWRRYVGERTCTVVKFRDSVPGKSTLIQPDDGSKRYYAWDSSIRYRFD
ncbi:hypothetical protein I6F34_01360 [Bradyrhizobium sp. BRP05]|nr:hypothetical protein [Bradyrhizobium sp. BRP05]